MTRRRPSTGPIGIRRLISLCVALLALAGQVALGGAGMRAGDMAFAASDASMTAEVICQSGHPAETDHAPAQRHRGDCAACPVCFALAHAALPGRSPAASARSYLALLQPLAPPATPRPAVQDYGPPAYPTGPPSLT
jgi:hypothetical protein